MPGPDVLAANERMIREQLVARGLDDPRLLSAFRSAPRELFVPADLRGAAYEDGPLPLPRGQTISQPFIVARMTELLRLRASDSVLEIGTGSGYQTAILARLAGKVYSAEIEPALADEARQRLGTLGITNVELRVGDALHIFADRAPFQAILSAAAPLSIPEPLVDQLDSDGRMILPVGAAQEQYLWLIEKGEGTVRRTQLDPVRFVPLRSAGPTAGP